MAEERSKRRLAAILAADVVGFSKLMETDEAGTLAALKARRRDVLEPLVAKHQGRIFKITGDGVLVEFASAVNAVQCAVDLQQAFASANANLPDERQIILRMGVNLGDVMVEGGDIYGDGVNIAARLESLADPGGILVSGTAYDYVRNKVKVGFDDIGTQNLKNMSEPVKAYRVTGTPAVTAVAPKATTDKPSVAVLPFTNMSDDPEQEYFSDGITEDIITELSRFRSLFVIARNSSFAFKGKSAKVQEIARELGVSYVVEGSVRKVGDRVRITAQLVDSPTGNHLWAERYDREMRDIFAIQDDVVSKIAARVAGQVSAAGIEKARRKGTESLVAYDYFLRGLERMTRVASEDIEPARQLFQKAIDIDPNFAQAHAGLAHVHLHLYWAGFYKANHSETGLTRALEAATRAVALDGNDATCHRALAQVHLHGKSFELARHHFDKAMTLNPNDIRLIANRGTFEIFTGRPDVALTLLDEAERRDPQLPNWFWAERGHALYHLRRYADAAAAFERVTAAPVYVDQFRAACYAQLDRIDEARAIAVEALRREPHFTLRRYAMLDPFQSRADLDHMLEGLRKAGMPE